MTTISWSSQERFSNRLSAFPWAQAVPLSLTDIFLYSYEVEFMQSLLSTGRKRLASQFNFTYYRYIDDVLSINNPELKNYLGHMYPLEFEIKDTMGSNTFCFLLWIYSCQSEGTVNFTLPFTSVTILVSILQTFRSWAATSHPRLPMAFLSHNSSDTPGLAPLNKSYECFILRAVQLSNKLLGQGYVKERLRSSLRKFYGRYGDLIKQYEVPSPECYTTYWMMTI